MTQLNSRQFLQEELLARCKRNPAYSARALARDLGLSAPFLSQVLSGQRILSEDRAQAVSNRLSWPKWKRTAFTRITRYESVRDPQLQSQILNEVKALLKGAPSRSPLTRPHKMRLDEFKIVSDWYYMAIYELSSTRHFNSDPRWIANKLDISPHQVEAAIARLVHVQLMQYAGGVLCKRQGSCRMGATPSLAIQSLHEQHLNMAKKALAEQEQNMRDFSGTTMSIDPKKLPRAKALIRRFNQQLMQLLETGERTAVYHFAAQLYRLDRAQEFKT
jgi:uncharacterized protein (TIGR02147 family)